MQEKIYKNSPYLIKSLLVNLKAFFNNKKRYNKYYDKAYKELLNNFVSKDINLVKCYQHEKVKELLLESFQFSKYYRSIFNKLKIEENDIIDDPIKILKQLPLLSKSILRENPDDIINTNPHRKISSINFTSGTTGTPTKTYNDYESQAISFALWNRFHYMIGLNKSDRHIRMSYKEVVNMDCVNPPFWIYNKVDNQLLMSVYHLNERNLNSYIQKIKKFKPKYIDGSPSAIHVLAEFITRNNIELNFSLKGICTTAETLFTHQRIDIEKAFNCKVFNQYASSEGSPFITECINGKMHLNEDSGVFEILDENDHEVKAGIGRLVVTSLRSWKTPLIRYDIGDYVELGDNYTCDCGSPFRVVENVLGRANDLFWTKEKGFVRATISSSIKNEKGIIEMQIIQKEPNIININIVVNKDIYNIKTEEVIKQNLYYSLGKDLNIDFIYSDKILNEGKGKFKFIKREFNIHDY